MRTTGIIKVVQLTGKIDKLGSDQLARTDFLSFILRSAVSSVKLLHKHWEGWRCLMWANVVQAAQKIC